MKKILPVLLLAVAVKSEAQLTPGQKLLGGNLSFSTSSNDNLYGKQTQSYINLNPRIGIVKNKNTIHGIFVSLGYNGAKTYIGIPSQEVRQRNYSAGAGAYIQKLKWLNDKWFLYAEGGVQAGYGFRKEYLVTDDNKKNTGHFWNAGVYVTPGVSFKVSEKILLDLLFNNLLNASYAYNKNKQTGLPSISYSDGHSFNISSNLNNTNLGDIGVGFRIIL